MNILIRPRRSRTIFCCVFKDIQLPAGPGRLEAVLQEGAAILGVKYVEVKRQN